VLLSPLKMQNDGVEYMKGFDMRILIVTLAFLGVLTSVDAQSQSLLETTDQARARHSADNYNTYRNNRNSAPLGGYGGSLGDPQPYGTSTPGLNNGYNTNGYGNNNSSGGSSGYGQQRQGNGLRRY
jgi:hypothetical protein